MLSDEEKKAIEYWKYIRDTQIYDGYKGQVYAVTLLNLTEKQSKEINELSDKLTKKICKGVEEEILEEYRQTIISKDKEIEELKEVKWYYEISRVPKDKIKAKIEEQDKIINTGGIDFNTKSYARCKKEALQSLLEKE